MPKSVAARSSKRPNPLPAQFIPLPPNFIQFKYLGFIIAGIYCTLLSWSAWVYHVVGDYNVETDFYWSYIPEAKSLLRGIVSIEDFRGPVYLRFWVSWEDSRKTFFTAVFAFLSFLPAAFLSFCFIHGRLSPRPISYLQAYFLSL